MGTTYDQGDLVQTLVKFTTSTGSTAAAEPTTVKAFTEKPDGTVTGSTRTSTSTGAVNGITLTTTGGYHIQTLATSSGLYEIRFTSTGVVTTSIESWFHVRSRRVSS